MRGEQRRSEGLFSYIRLEERIARDHPLRAIRVLVNEVLAALSDRFEELYSDMGRPSIAPEYLLRATLAAGILHGALGTAIDGTDRLQSSVSLVCRFVDRRCGLGRHGVHEEPRPTAGGRCGARVLGQLAVAAEGEAASIERSLLGGRNADEGLGLDEELSAEGREWRTAHDGGRNGERNFRREKRSNETHESTTDPDAKLYRKGDGQESRLCYMGHVLMENRNGLAVAGDVTQATGTAEREAALDLIDDYRPGRGRITLGADKAFDVEDFVEALRERKVTPHIAIDGHVTKTGKTAQDSNRRTHPAPSRLRDQPTLPQTDRGSVRLDQDDWRNGAGQSSWARQGSSRLHLRNPRLQPRAYTQASGGR